MNSSEYYGPESSYNATNMEDYKKGSIYSKDRGPSLKKNVKSDGKNTGKSIY